MFKKKKLLGKKDMSDKNFYKKFSPGNGKRNKTYFGIYVIQNWKYSYKLNLK